MNVGSFKEKMQRILRCEVAISVLAVFMLMSSNEMAANTPWTHLRSTPQDSTYVLPMRQYLSIRAYNIIKTTDLQVRNRDVGQPLIFRPNNGLGIGLGFTYKILALDLGFVIPATMRYRGDNPTTKFDLLSTLYGKKHVFDLTLQYYEGYDLANANAIFDGNPPQSALAMRSDISSVDLALSYLYVMNHDKFSFQASFLGDVIQRKSAGSVTIHGFAGLYGLSADSALVRHEFGNGLDRQAHITQVTNLSTGTGIGYAHTFVLPRNFFITLSGAPLLMLNATLAEVNHPEYDDIEDTRFNMRLFTRNAVGYNAKRFYLIFNLIYDNFLVRAGEETRIDYAPLKMKLFFGYRIGKDL